MNKIYIISIIFLLMVGIVSAEQIIYREDADYNSPDTNFIDNDWNTYDAITNSYVFNYNKTDNATNAIWQIKDGFGIRNFTISDDCFSGNDTVIKLFVEKVTGSYNRIYYRCFVIDSDGDNSYQDVGDSYQDVGYVDYDVYGSNLYEEGVYWKLENQNIPPVSNAGPDLIYIDYDGNGMEEITFNATRSYDKDGTIVKYEWIESGVIISNEPIYKTYFTVLYSPFNITLKVTDNLGAYSTDELILKVLNNKKKYIYQENANGKNNIGIWYPTINYLFDNNWNTYTLAYTQNKYTYEYLNYTKKMNSISSLWNIKYECNLNKKITQNLTIPSVCNRNTIQLRIKSWNRGSGINNDTYLECYTGSYWKKIKTLQIILPLTSCKFYEEGMYWIMW